MAAYPVSETWYSSTTKVSLQVFKGEVSRCQRAISLTLAEIKDGFPGQAQCQFIRAGDRDFGVTEKLVLSSEGLEQRGIPECECNYWP
jgi:hypothetical protein